MKKIVLIILIGSGITFSGCKKFLDKEPDNRENINTPQKVGELLASAYPHTNYQCMAEMSSDNIGDNIVGDAGDPDWAILDKDLYYYQDHVGSGANDVDNPEKYWYSAYKAIAVTNLALEHIDKAPDQDAYKPYRGEALVARAYAHFMLVNFFAKFYNPATASTDPGIPYVTVPETSFIKAYERKNVQYVYGMIEKDLLEGLPLINDNIYSVPKYHFNKAAANAFAARFYLYKKDYVNVIKYANAAIPEATFLANLRPWNSVYNTLPINGNNSLQATYSKATEKANLLLVECQSWWFRLLSGARFGSNSDTLQMVTGSEPVTGGGWSYSSASAGGGPFIPKIDEYFVETSIGSGIGEGWQMIPLLTSEEVLFNLAEAYTYNNQPDKAISLLNIYLSTRIDSYSATVNKLTQQNIDAWALKNKPYSGLNFPNIVSLILYYKRIEYMHEGMRWFDIIRNGIEIAHTIKNTRNEVVQTISLNKDNPHRIFQLPITVSQAGLPLNSPR